MHGQIFHTDFKVWAVATVLGLLLAFASPFFPSEKAAGGLSLRSIAAVVGLFLIIVPGSLVLFHLLLVYGVI